MMKKMACQIAGETRLLLAVRERTESKRISLRCRIPRVDAAPFPAPPQAKRAVEEFMSAAAARGQMHA